MKPHTIRLAGFWVSTPEPKGGMKHVRAFGSPTRPNEGDQVWIVTDGPRQVTVNGVALGKGNEFRIDEHLEPRNVATILTPDGTTLGDVVMEIRPAA